MDQQHGDTDAEKIAGRSSARMQHYLPQLLLNSFAKTGRGKKRQITVFDKHQDRTFTASVNKVFAERDFYTFTSDNGNICLEDGFSQVESDAAPILARIKQQNRIVLTKHELGTLALFVALLHTRTGAYRRHIQEIATHVRGIVAANFDNNEEALADIDRSLDPEVVKLQALGFVANSAEKIAELLLAKAQVLFSSRQGGFLIGDTLVVLHNDKQFGPYGNLGFAVPGIQIYLPLTENLVLGFLCPSIVRGWVLQAERFERQRQQVAALAIVGAPEVARRARESLTQFEAAVRRSNKLLDEVRVGSPIECSAGNVTFMNSLQVQYAERYVASRDGDFSLVRRMIGDREDFRRGRRLSLN